MGWLGVFQKEEGSCGAQGGWAVSPACSPSPHPAGDTTLGTEVPGGLAAL